MGQGREGREVNGGEGALRTATAMTLTAAKTMVSRSLRAAAAITLEVTFRASLTMMAAPARLRST